MPVQVVEADLCEVTETVWETALGMHVKMRTEGPVSAAPSICGYVRISGAWEGIIVLESSPELARRIAARLLGTTPEDTTGEEVRDAFGELANIIGGNLKGMLPGPSKLSVPEVQIMAGRQCESLVPRASGLLAAAFECDGEPMRVAVVTTGPSR